MAEQQSSSQAYQNSLNAKELCASRCLNCQTIFLPPRPLCTHCGSEQLEEVELSGRGRLLTYTVIYVGTSAMTAAGYHRGNPYCAGIVQLEEGPRVSSQILGLDLTNPAGVALNIPVQAVFIERGEGDQKRSLLAFTA